MKKVFSPFAAVPADSVSDWRESGLLREIARWMAAFPKASAAIDDDCALLEVSRERRLVTVDSLIYGRHFDDAVEAYWAGRKLLARNLSDIAADGGQPSDAVLALVMSGDVAKGWLKDFYRGILENCVRYGLRLVGGDVASVAGTGFFSATLTLTGFGGTRVLRRSGARAGDFICVSGTLGGSLKSGRHFRFEPRLALGRLLAEENLATACMDLTDGLAKDLPALVPAGTHAELDLAAIPLSAAAEGVGSAFSDGEDYELLFTVAPENFERLLSRSGDLKISKIGSIVAGTASAGTPFGLPFGGGFEHF
ncbi:MAG: thiamine-phosphate kinase [Opitutales bacterium]|nr:thiamine-phosphate kinase [Opitutales bacterium]